MDAAGKKEIISRYELALDGADGPIKTRAIIYDVIDDWGTNLGQSLEAIKKQIARKKITLDDKELEEHIDVLIKEGIVKKEGEKYHQVPAY